MVQETTNRGARDRTSTELMYTGEVVPGWNDDFYALWNEAMDEASLREYF